jgi:hypothetical protein
VAVNYIATTTLSQYVDISTTEKRNIHHIPSARLPKLTERVEFEATKHVSRYHEK